MNRVGLSTAGYALLAAMLILVFLGSLTIYSASDKVTIDENGIKITSRLDDHLLKVFISIAFLAFMAMIPPGLFRRSAGFNFIILLVLLFVILVIPKSWNLLDTAHGSVRRLNIAGFQIQPSEFMKLFIVFYVASYISKKSALKTGDLQNFRRGFVPVMTMIGVSVILVNREPDLSSSIIIFLTALVMLVAGGVRLKHILLTVGSFIPFLVITILTHSYRINRIRGLLHTRVGKVDVLNEYTYQIFHSFVAFGSGGLKGIGSGCSMQRFHLPQPFTDVIFSIIGEELGLIGASFIVFLFTIIAWAGFRIAYEAADDFDYLVIIGLTTSILINAAMHMSVCLALMPVTGVTLPFVSYGGSSLMVSMASIGVILGLDARRRSLRP